MEFTPTFYYDWIKTKIKTLVLCTRKSGFSTEITPSLQVQNSTVYLVEGGVSLKLTLVDTPGFGDAINNTKWFVDSSNICIFVRNYAVCLINISPHLNS